MSPINPSPVSSCVDPCDIGSTPYREALSAILNSIEPTTDTEQLPIRSALGRIAAEDVRATADIPISRNSAMDGYACRISDLNASNTIELELIGTSAAGKPFHGSVQAGQCVRILTGAVVPDQLNVVVMQEECTVAENKIIVKGNHKADQFIRQAGEDLARGEVAISKGQSIQASELGVLASVGCSEISVFRNPTVAFFSTGDELRGIGEPLGEGDVYDSNRYSLFGLLISAGATPIDMGVVRDDFSSTVSALKNAADAADFVITTAGASVGDSDFVRLALEKLGELRLWKVAMKPGRPLAFGKIDSSWFFGLPGNPVSVLVTFDKFVRPALGKFSGDKHRNPVRLLARSAQPIRKSVGRLEFQRGVLTVDKNGDASVASTGNQSSGVLTSMSRANCYIVLPLECGDLPAGSKVWVEPFDTHMLEAG